MFKPIALILLFMPLLWLTWGRGTLPPDSPQAVMQVDDLTASVTAQDRIGLGPFVFKRLWRLSAWHGRFGGYSALVPLASGELLAIGDRNSWARFPEPVRAGVMTVPVGRALRWRSADGDFTGFDIESAVRDPVDESIWFGLEDEHYVARVARGSNRAGFTRVARIRDWPENGSVEAMARLADGRWVMLCESCEGGKNGHLGLLFGGHPGASTGRSFRIATPQGFDPVDMATLPDGRLLILARRFHLFPPRFVSRIVLADMTQFEPGQMLATHELARIERPGLRENYEGIAVRAAKGGRMAVWVISDANDSEFQETRLLELSLDIGKLPAAH